MNELDQGLLWSGHGCIQKRLTETTRINVWVDDFPHITTEGGKCHDHRFYFRSTVLRGIMLLYEYDFRPAPFGESGDYRGWRRNTEKQFEKDSTFEDLGEYIMLTERTRRTVYTGQQYVYGGPGLYHIAKPFHGTVTLLTKVGLVPDYDPVIITKEPYQLEHALNVTPSQEELAEVFDREMAKVNL